MRAMARNGLAAVAATCIVTGAAAQQDITTLSLEQLLDVEVYSASKFGQRVSDAPAAVRRG